MTKKQLQDFINQHYGKRPAEWRISKTENPEKAFEDWDGTFYNRERMYKFIKNNGAGCYVIEPYYKNNFGKFSGTSEFGERIFIEVKL